MTLRHRLLLVYFIVVLLSAATVGVAVFELRHSRQIIRELQDWNRIVRRVEELTAPDAPLDVDFADLIPRQYIELALAPDYLEVEQVLKAINEVQLKHKAWLELDPDQRQAQVDMVRQPLQRLAQAVQYELSNLNVEAAKQDVRTRILLIVVVCLTTVHVAVIGSLLRRWLLRPIEQLGRQVDALARDEPPAEPLLVEPTELANLAKALDRARRSLGQLRQQLIENERLTTIGQFAAQLAHNLRNPLASIRAVAQVAARHDDDDGYVTARMTEIVASVDRLNRWIAGLMEVAQREPTPTRTGDVMPILWRIKDALTPELATKELTLVVEAPDGHIDCAHDPETLEHALIAMVVNAIEASPPGETITLRAERVTGDQTRPGSCRILVRDRGTGLPEGDPDRVFDFSFSTKQLGMGLGLALARLGLERQGGIARARNNADRGATVYVELPIRPPEPGTTEELQV